MTRKQKRLLTRIIVAAALFLAGNFIPLPQPSKGGSFAARWITQEAVSAMSEVR